jgi:nicotinamide phosphoribosyltransferase
MFDQRTPFNPILATDSYKVTHWPVYPEGTEYLYSYLESRGGKFSETVFFGLQYYIMRYLMTPITQQMIDKAEKRFIQHFGTNVIFNRAGWEHILKKYNGYLPLRIKAPLEGSVIPTRNVLMTIENTDPACYWLVNYMETMLLKVWYTITVATLSREIKKVINRYLEETGDPNLLPFKLHDFGYRGASSEESACLGGAAHLVNFMGTDTFGALDLLSEFYAEEMAGFSIPATEHSIMTALGEMGESRMMERFLQTFGQGNYPAIACVSDQYNIYNACENIWGGELKQMVLNLKPTLVIRPDSGEPVVVVVQVIETLARKFGFTTNDKGFKVLNTVRVIQGDGVNLESITAILDAMKVRGWSADNVAFGMGGALLQQVNRDTQKFAIKASSIIINGRQSDVFKDPKTDTGKRSKRGRLKLYKEDGTYTTLPESEPGKDELVVYYENGRLPNEQKLADIRERAALPKTNAYATFE